MRLIDADALKEKKVYSEERHEKVVPVSEIDWAHTIDAIPVEWLIEKRNSVHVWQVEGAINWLLQEWQDTKSIEELQAESEMRDYAAEQEADNG